MPVLRRAHKANRVDQSLNGGWGDVREKLGVEREPDDPPDERDRSWDPVWFEKAREVGRLLAQRAQEHPGTTSGTAGDDEDAWKPSPIAAAQQRRHAEKQKLKARAQRKAAKRARKQSRRR